MIKMNLSLELIKLLFLLQLLFQQALEFALL